MTVPNTPVETNAPHERGPLAWMAKNGVAANLLMLILIVGGLIMAPRIKQEVFPEFELDLVTVEVLYPGASPAEVEQGVILAIEEAVRGIDGVKEVRATAQENMGRVSIELLLGSDADQVLANVKSAVDRITSFPVDSERPIISLASMRTEVISLVLYGDKTESELRHLAEQTRDALLQTEEITLVELFGTRPYEISVEVAQETLRKHGLTLEGIAHKISQASVELPGGGVKTDSGEVLLRTAQRRDVGEQFEQIMLISNANGSQLRLGDVAHVADGFRETEQAAFFEGSPAVMIRVYRVGDQTPIELAKVVKDYALQNEKNLPAGVSMAIWNDASQIYKDRINLLLRNAFLGLILVLVTLGFFLELRLAFWVTIGIPISFIGSLLFMPTTDVSLNMLSLFAFLVTLGIVVDDAIVVGEAIYKYREAGLRPHQAAIAGVREVASPVVFAILTTILAFMPLFFIPGLSGKFFSVIAVIVVLVLALSLVEALFILPAHLAHSKQRTPSGLLGWIHKRQQRFAQLVNWLIEKTYKPSLALAIRRRYLTASIAIAILILAIGLVAGKRVHFTFMPKIDSDRITATLEMPFGVAVERTQQVAKQLQKAAHKILEENRSQVQSISLGMFTQIGGLANSRSGQEQGLSSGSHLAQVSVFLVPSDKRSITASQFASRWRKTMGDVAGMEALTFQYSAGPGRTAAIALDVSHTNQRILERSSSDLAMALREFQGVIDIDDGFRPGKEQLTLELKPAGRSLGITELDLARQVRSAFFGAEATRQQRGRDEVRTYVRFPRHQRSSEYNIEQLLLRAPQGGEIPLGHAATVSRGQSYTSINRTDNRRVLTVKADVERGVANANEVIAELQQNTIPTLQKTYPGLEIQAAGQQKQQKETFASLGLGFTIALLCMFSLLAIAFRSYIQPIIIMAAIPFGFVGTLIGHMIMGYDLSLISMMGLVALSGIVVNDSLILIVAINKYRLQGMDISQAIVEGGHRRFRPIILTSLTTFLGLMPMILEPSVQARFLIPMAISLGFGVLFATFVTLVITPVVYLILEDIKGLVAQLHCYLQGRDVLQDISNVKACPDPEAFDFTPFPIKKKIDIPETLLADSESKNEPIARKNK